jgi:uncharacterized protein (DUF362 family)/ferredoxin
MEGNVHITRCSSYAPDVLKEQVREHLDLRFGPNDLTGRRVLLKVNLLKAAEPEQAITTHPELLRAMINYVHERGGKAIIGDSSGGPFLPSLLKRAYDASGFTKIAKETGAELNFNTGAHEEAHPTGRFVKRFNVGDYLRNADIVIAVPKLKTHMLCGLTCASKVMFGVVPGLEKVRLHTRFPDPVDFSRMVLDLTELAGAHYYIVDAVEGMDWNGPSAGRVRKVGLMVSGREPVQIDLALCRTTGLPPERLNIMRAAFKDKRVTPDLVPEVTGNGADLKLDPPFRMPERATFAAEPPGAATRFVRRVTTKGPTIDLRKCVGCGVCGENCAGNAITIEYEQARIEMSKCIRCYCCHEMCPYDAVKISIAAGPARVRFEKLLYEVIGWFN